MRSTFKVLFSLKRNKEKDRKVVPVMGRISVNGSIAQFCAKLSVPETLWEVRGGHAKGHSLEADRINRHLDNIRPQIGRHYQDICDYESYVTAEKVKDTIHTTELDTDYARSVELLRKRKYAKALYILNDYNDRNTVVAHLSLDHNERAMELLAAMPEDAATEYLRAIACSRLGRKEEGRRHFLEACRLDERMEYRGNLDPEIAELLK